MRSNLLKVLCVGCVAFFFGVWGRRVEAAVCISEILADNENGIEDEDGDALDALVLVPGSWISQRLSPGDWKERFAELEAGDTTVEGWFPV